jgi:predicted SAM-dependent methyltransferase
VKLNIGCGFLKLDGYVNIDREELCKPDMQFDLQGPWPLEDNSVEEIVAHHVLEHLGETYAKFLGVLQEMYRVSKSSAIWKIAGPHWQNDMFYHDPTHVRVISPVTLQMYDQANNVHDFNMKGHQSKLGLFSKIDIEVVKHQYILSEPWNSRMQQTQVKLTDLDEIGRNFNNVCHEIQMEVVVHKPQRFADWIEAHLSE